MIASTSFPGWANIYLSPTTLGSITMVITMGFAGGFTGGYFASRGDPFWTISGGLAGVIGVSAGADVYAPTLAYLLSMLTAVLVVYAGNWIETKMRVDDAVGAVAVHGVCGFLGMFWVGVFAAGYPTGINNVESSIGGQLMGMIDVPAARLPVGLDRVVRAARSSTCCACPVEVELEGLDLVEYGTLVYPEMGVIKEQIVEPDGTLVDVGDGDPARAEQRPPTRVTRGRAARCSPSLISLAIMFAVVGASFKWYERAERRRDLGGGPCPRSLTAPRLRRPCRRRAAGRRLGRLHPPEGVREVRRDS